jgi:quinoprotein glucose dehydrogenase
VAETITMVESDRGSDSDAHPGERIYRVNCAPCHGLDMEGDSQSIPGLTALPETADKDSTKQIIRDGRGQMPPFPNLSKEQIQVVTDYLHDEETLENIQLEAGDGFRYPPFVSTGHKPFRDPNDYPANKPPWGVLNAIDLSQGEILWQATLGEHAELLEQGLPPTGTFNMGGSIVTAGGLVFIGATKDEKFRAFDKETGEILWEYQLNAGAYATPCTYEIQGKQYVVIAAGGGGKPGTRSGDAYVAFALP